MANNNSNDHDEVRVQKMILDDGRNAERHISVDGDGNEVVEIFAEEKRPLKLEKRIQREFKSVIAKETHQTIKDGEVAHVEVRSGESDVPLKVVERIGIVDHAKIVDGDYVRKDEIGKIVADSVVTGVTALMENMEPMSAPVVQSVPQPIYRAQAVVESNVAEKAKTDSTVSIIMILILVAQLGFFAWMYLK